MNAIARARREEPDQPSPEGIFRQRLVARRAEMLAYFRRRLGTLEDAEDALQDVSLKAVRAAPGIASPERADAWLGQVMRNTLVDRYRRSAARRRGEEAFGREVLATGAQSGAAAQAAPCRCVRAALGDLKPDQAELIRRLDLAEEPRETVAAALGITANTLGVRLHRARKALKRRIQALCPTCAKGQFRLCDCSVPAGPGNDRAA